MEAACFRRELSIPHLDPLKELTRERITLVDIGKQLLQHVPGIFIDHEYQLRRDGCPAANRRAFRRLYRCQEILAHQKVPDSRHDVGHEYLTQNPPDFRSRPSTNGPPGARKPRGIRGVRRRRGRHDRKRRKGAGSMGIGDTRNHVLPVQPLPVRLRNQRALDMEHHGFGIDAHGRETQKSHIARIRGDSVFQPLFPETERFQLRRRVFRQKIGENLHDLLPIIVSAGPSRI